MRQSFAEQGAGGVDKFEQPLFAMTVRSPACPDRPTPSPPAFALSLLTRSPELVEGLPFFLRRR